MKPHFKVRATCTGWQFATENGIYLGRIYYSGKKSNECKFTLSKIPSLK